MKAQLLLLAAAAQLTLGVAGTSSDLQRSVTCPPGYLRLTGGQCVWSEDANRYGSWDPRSTGFRLVRRRPDDHNSRLKNSLREARSREEEEATREVSRHSAGNRVTKNGEVTRPSGARRGERRGKMRRERVRDDRRKERKRLRKFHRRRGSAAGVERQSAGRSSARKSLRRQCASGVCRDLREEWTQEQRQRPNVGAGQRRQQKQTGRSCPAGFSRLSKGQCVSVRADSREASATLPLQAIGRQEGETETPERWQRPGEEQGRVREEGRSWEEERNRQHEGRTREQDRRPRQREGRLPEEDGRSRQREGRTREEARRTRQREGRIRQEDRRTRQREGRTRGEDEHNRQRGGRPQEEDRRTRQRDGGTREKEKRNRGEERRRQREDRAGRRGEGAEDGRCASDQLQWRSGRCVPVGRLRPCAPGSHRLTSGLCIRCSVQPLQQEDGQCPSGCALSRNSCVCCRPDIDLP